MAAVRIICEPCECCVQPSAYRMVITRLGAEHSAIISQIFRNWSCGVPVIPLTTSGV